MTFARPVVWLFVPAARLQLLPKAINVADVVVVDLEDATHPSMREAARRELAEAIPDVSPVPIVVRVNPVSTPEFERDLAAIEDLGRTGRVAGIRLAKTESETEAAIAVDGTSAWKEPWIVCVLESARAITQVDAIASTSGIHSIMLGEADLKADLRLPRGLEGESGLSLARQQVVRASRAAGLPPPVGSEYTYLDDLDGLARTTRTLRSLGFYGRSCIHPSQVQTVRDGFAPTAEELAWARDVRDRAAQMDAESSTSGMASGGTFVDPAIVLQATNVLDLEPVNTAIVASPASQ